MLILLTYFIGTNFFWMFVEGHYLYILVVKTFSIELINIHKYMFVGYGLPALIIAVWAPIKIHLTNPPPVTHASQIRLVSMAAFALTL